MELVYHEDAPDIYQGLHEHLRLLESINGEPPPTRLRN